MVDEGLKLRPGAWVLLGDGAVTHDAGGGLVPAVGCVGVLMHYQGDTAVVALVDEKGETVQQAFTRAAELRRAQPEDIPVARGGRKRVGVVDEIKPRGWWRRWL